MRAASTRPSAAAATERSGSHCGRTRLTITAPGRRSAACSSATVSRVSVTGRSSSSVTRCTAVCGECTSRTTPSLWLWIGPVRARSDIARVTSRKLTTRPVGGASRTTAS